LILRADPRADAIVRQLVTDQLIVTQLLLQFEMFQNAPLCISVAKTFLRVHSRSTAP
jgi:hypothetical protein